MSRKQIYIAGSFILAFVALLGSSFHHLYNSPIVGIGVSWDKPNNHYDVVTARRWSPLRTGDVIKRIGGITTNISLLAEVAQHLISPGEIQGALATIASLSRESLSEIRSFIQCLDPREVTWEALTIELRHSGSTMVSAHQVAFDMQTSCGVLREEPGCLLFLNIIRIYKESLTNVIKHSRSRSVKVTLALAPEKFTLAVRDDGIGLESAAGKKTGRGITHMQARVAEVGGRLWVEADQGTCVHLAIPLPIKYPSPVWHRMTFRISI